MSASDAPAAPKPLSAREQMFVAALLADREMNQTNAAIAAGYSPRTAKSVGSEVANRPHVKAAIETAQAKRRARLQVDGDWIVRRAVTTYRKAHEAGDYSPAVSALTLIGKLQGLLADRLKVDLRDVSKMSDAELEAEAKTLGLPA